MKNVEEIMKQRESLTADLHNALSTMERKSTIYDLRVKLLELQKECPHFSPEHNFTIVDGRCPYCGATIFKDIVEEEEE